MRLQLLAAAKRPILYAYSFRKAKAFLTGAAAALVLLGYHPHAAAQAGKNSARTVTAAGTILNEYTALTANVVVGATTITVASSTLNANGRFPTNLAAGDLILVVQPQGAEINAADMAAYGTVTALNNAGRYQLVEVAAVPSATTITLNCEMFSSFTTAGRTQVVRVPRYTTLDLDAGATVSAPAWNGSTGGVVALETTGAVTLGSGASLDVTALGFRGGAVEQSSSAPGTNDFSYRSSSALAGAEKGESIAGSATTYDALNGRYGRGAAANGGGGGNAHNAAGGGGANAAALGAAYTGTGNPDRGPGNAYDAAWNLEAAGFATSASSGGGRGGYSYSSTNQNALTVGPGLSSWGGDFRQNMGGLGGRPVAASGRAFFGGGGGAGDSNNNTGTAGAVGGGFIYLVAGGPVSGGSLVADGGSVNVLSGNDAGGGGGGGGSVVVNAPGLVSSALLARGGRGGSQAALAVEAEGAGGGGGGGYLAYSGGSPSTDVSGGLNGTSASASVTEFLPNGGTGGGAGRVEAAACLAVLCPGAVADVATSISFGNNPQPANQTAIINVAFVNNGPDAAANVGRTVFLPANLGAGAVTVTTASGTGSYDNTTGEVTFLPATIASLASGANANVTVTYTPVVAGNQLVSSAISTTSDQACSVSNDASGDNTLVVVYPADLLVTLSGPATAAASSAITYTATVQNISSGPNTADATSVVLTLQLPKALLIRTFPAGTIYDFNTGIATITVGQLNRGASARSYAFTFTLPNNTQPVAGSASAAGFEADPDVTNNDGVAATMQAATTVTLPVSTGACAGSTFDNATPATQGLYAEYYKTYFADNLTFFNAPRVPNLARTDGSVNYAANNAWGNIAGAAGSGDNTNPDLYSARYRGFVTIANAGVYTFALTSDDASYLWLDNAARTGTTPVLANATVNNGGTHSPRLVTSVPVNMTAGPHALLAFFGESNGGNIFTISYSGPDTGGSSVAIPQSALCSRQFSGGPLPVELTAFTVRASGRAALLSWATAMEKNNDRFEVERSRDGRAFDQVGAVRGQGTSTSRRTYAFEDATAAGVGSTVYYRLRQVDTDGTATYSSVQTVVFAAALASPDVFSLYPNPAQKRVVVNLAGGVGTAGAGVISLCDLTGRVLLRKAVVAGAPAAELDLENLAAGVYLVQVEQGGRRYTQRLLHTRAF